MFIFQSSWSSKPPTSIYKFLSLILPNKYIYLGLIISIRSKTIPSGKRGIKEYTFRRQLKISYNIWDIFALSIKQGRKQKKCVFTCRYINGSMAANISNNLACFFSRARVSRMIRSRSHLNTSSYLSRLRYYFVNLVKYEICTV